MSLYGSISCLILGIGLSVSAADLSSLTQQPASQRVAAIQSLRGQALSEADIQQLIAWVNQPTAYNDMKPIRQDLFFNELLATLRELHGVQPDLLVAAFTACIRDETRSVVHRDYALQHLGQLYEKNDLPQESLDVAFETIEGENDQLAATALRTLERAYLQQRPLDEDRLKTKVLSCLKQPRPPALHLSAIHAAATLNLTEALPIIRKDVFDPGTDPNRQLVALYALGELGTAQDERDLQDLTLSHPRCEIALRAAKKKLNQKFPNLTS